MTELPASHSTPKRRVLVATNHLMRISGSETVALEIVRYLSSRDCDVTVYASWFGPPMHDLFAAVPNVVLSSEPEEIRPFSYDIVYAQHQVLGLFDYVPSPDDREATLIAAGRLSRQSFLESGGWLHDQLLVDRVFANSELTAEHLVHVGWNKPITTFYNAAPDAFFKDFSDKPERPENILVVTNHKAPSLMGALGILGKTKKVIHIGRSAKHVEPVTPEMIFNADLVISIGKTVPYALAARIPVYVYDHFGGPGYLDDDNCERVARFNFTGRCCERVLTPEAIADEVLRVYPKGVQFARDMPQEWLKRYRLSQHLDLLFQPQQTSNVEKRVRMAKNPFLFQERLLAQHVRQSYIREQKLIRRLVDAESRQAD